MGLFGFLRRGDEDAIPKPGTPEFEAAVQGSAIPDSRSVSMGEPGWTSQSAANRELDRLGIDPSKAQVEESRGTIDLRGTGARERVEGVLREHGIDPDRKGQTIDASKVPGLRESILGALTGVIGTRIPNAGGFGGGISPPRQEPLAVVEELAKRRDAGQITDAEFEAQKRRILGE